MNRSRLQAYTILEMSIAMLISAIAISITYTIYGIILRSYAGYDVSQQRQAAIVRLDERLQKDFSRADIVLADDRAITCQITGTPVTYEFQPDLVIRRSTVTDTFRVQVSGLQTLFEQEPLNVATEAEESRRIDELLFNVAFEDKNIPYHYLETYSSVNLIQRKSHAIY